MMSVAQHGEDLPWREGNAFRLLRDAETFYPAMLDAITGAQISILLEMYLVSSGETASRFIDALCAAADRGVDVFVLLDDFGSRTLNTADRQRLKAHHVPLTLYNPLRFWRFRHNLSRDHRKLLLVDGRIAYTGGLGITDDFLPSNSGAPAWRETAIAIHGPVLQDWQQMFAHTWNRWAALPLVDSAPVGDAPAGDALGRLRCSLPGRRHSFGNSLLRQALRAQQRIWIATAYFIPGRRLRRVLAMKASQGVDVRLLLPGPITDHPGVRYASHHYYGALLRDGVRIFEYQPRFLHTKLALCDDWLSIGSSNFDRWNLRRNLEANQEVADAGLAEQACKLFEADLEQAREFFPEQLRYRSWLEALRAWFWRLTERLLDKDR